MISIDLKTHPEQYFDYRKAIEYCKTIPEAEMQETNFHVQWIGSPIGRMQAMTIKAFLTSQQDKAKLTVWVDRHSNTNEANELKDLVNFQFFDAKEEIKGTPFEGRNMNYWNTDIMRMVYLSKYGGVHIDMDTVLLRDLAPLLDQEFFYTWGMTEEIAGGVINLFKGSEVNNAICQAIIEGGHGLYKELFSYVREKHDFALWPCAWFNTEWAIRPEQYLDDDHFQFIRSPVKKNKYASEFYDGVFSWHWHNCWRDQIEDGSKWQLMEEFINKRFNHKFK